MDHVGARFGASSRTGAENAGTTVQTSAPLSAGRSSGVQSAAHAPQSMASSSQTQAAEAEAPSAAGTAAAASSGAAASQRTGGRGLVTASGAPLIIPNPEPADPSYRGPAAYNPYYWADFGPGNVAGYDNWFQTIRIGNFDQSATAYIMDPRTAANQEGGLEALRLVQQYVPDATLVAQNFNLQSPGQPPSYNVKLPDGTLLSGGLVLSWYYNNGYGVTQTSDLMLQEAVGLVSPWAAGTASHSGQQSAAGETVSQVNA